MPPPDHVQSFGRAPQSQPKAGLQDGAFTRTERLGAGVDAPGQALPAGRVLRAGLLVLDVLDRQRAGVPFIEADWRVVGQHLGGADRADASRGGKRGNVGRLAGRRVVPPGGARSFALAGGRSLTPSVAFGLRRDGGDAETGTGVEVGAGVGYADPARGLDVALRVYGLAAHADDAYGDWGVSGSLRLAPGAAGRGLTASLVPSYGTDPGGTERLWTLPDAGALAVDDGVPRSGRLDGEVGYGLAVPGGLTGTPYAGFGVSDAAREVRLGWRLIPAGGGSFAFTLDAVRREGAGGAAAGAEPAAEHRVGFGVTASW